MPRRPTSWGSVWLFRLLRNHSCGTARDLHPFPPDEKISAPVPARTGILYRIQGEKDRGKWSSWNKVKKVNHPPSSRASHSRRPVNGPLAQVSLPGATYFCLLYTS